MLESISSKHQKVNSQKKRCRQSISLLRLKAFKDQSGLCFYCSLPMCNGSVSEFSLKYNLTKNQVFQVICTGEHLKPFSEGGKDNRANIVACCHYCNRHRHLFKNPLSFSDYRAYVQKHVISKRWPPVSFFGGLYA
ncbi:MAG: HNH endonuclease [Methylococcales bacterium]|nr:HNH endonuclease [Methylococcales bacterium]